MGNNDEEMNGGVSDGGGSTDAGLPAGVDDADESFGDGHVADPVTACPPPTGNLIVTVINACSGLPIESVSVEVSGPEERSGATDPDGHAEFENLVVGEYLVTGSHADYPTENTTGSVFADTTTTAELTLQSPTAIQFIRQDNTAFPTSGNDACHMVSKFVTNVNLPSSATFAGPPGSPPDPDTFRVQLQGIPAGQSPNVRVEVLRSGSGVYTHLFNTVQGSAGGQVAYRINKHLRLVSNAPPSPKPSGATYDDEYNGDQTILVKLGDMVRATMVLGGRDTCRTELRVARPPSEDGPKAIRTVDIHFVTLSGASSAPGTIVDRISEDWAQVAVRFHLKSSATVTPVTNVLSIRGTAGSNGQLSVDITPQGGSQTSISAAITNGNSAEQMASALATAISSHAGLSATHHRHQSEWLVLVNKGREVNFAHINSTVTGIVFTEPPLNFNNDVDLLEGDVLGLNFKDTAPKSITMIGVKDVNVLGGDAAAGGNYLRTHLPGWHNVAILRQAVVDGDDGTYPSGAGHEMGHVLFDVGNPGHSGTTTNLFYAYENRNAPETFASRKRLTDTQNTDARTDSGPTTTPGLLQKK